MPEKMVPTLRLTLGGVPPASQVPGMARAGVRDRTNIEGGLGDDELDTEEEDPEEAGLLAEMEADLFGNDRAGDEETLDGPDWDFEPDEKTSPDKAYVFTPAVHRKQLLRLMTKAFCRHPIFPTQTGLFNAAQIRLQGVHAMYKFCHGRGLTETWAYFWSAWYRPSRWKLWARSSSPSLSRLRTTMTAENHFYQLKGDYLHFLHRPRLDHAVWVLVVKVMPAYMSRASGMEDTHRLGRGKALTTFQQGFKTAWKKKELLKVSDKKYDTNVANWLCNCGSQELDTYHCCKHLIQAVPKPSPEFWGRVVRRRVVPLYQDKELRREGEGSVTDDDGGCITDGDDHVWLGDKSVLENGGWRDMAAQIALKRRVRVESDDEGDVEGIRTVTGGGVEEGDDRGGKRRRVVVVKEEMVEEEEGSSQRGSHSADPE